MPAISVIIPAFNAEDSLPEALHSLQRQSFHDFEAIVVDDGSSDGTAAIAERIAASDQRFTVLRQPRNRGGAVCINSALDVVRGDWITVLDADDAYEPKRLETLLRSAERWGADLFADNLQLVEDGTGRPLGLCLGPDRVRREGPISFEEFLKLDAVDPGGRPRMGVGYLKPLIRRDFLNQYGIRYRTDLTSNYDGMFHAECLLWGARYVLSPRAHYRYTVARPGSIGVMSKGARSVTNRLQRCRLLLEHDRVDRFNGAAGLLRQEIRNLHHVKAYVELALALRGRNYGAALRYALTHSRDLPYVLNRLCHAALRKLRSEQQGTDRLSPRRIVSIFARNLVAPRLPRAYSRNHRHPRLLESEAPLRRG
ncbi:glycosyltransferase family 2 protein [Methylotetracoccus oryzae]|uniref:glycosyltransferase family 2 protein n=1 Tax=Methylotetracoccus oryzae TaxID=1919059 RepID=UPI00111A2D5E|nr:glycosyltransferase family 2 protein [Methylotetracoccus oryzae]